MAAYLPGIELLVARPSDPDGAAGTVVRALRHAATAIDKVAATPELTAIELLAVDLAVTRLVRAHQAYRRSLWWMNEVDDSVVQ